MLLAIGCQTRPQPQNTELVRRSQPLLGTFVTIVVAGSDRDWLNDCISGAFEEFHQVDALLSIHRTDSELSRLNARAAEKPVKVSAELFHVIATAQQISGETQGSFDVTIRPLADLWGFIWKREYKFPTEAELASVLPRVGWENVVMDAGAQTILYRRPGVSIDPGGIGKGYAVDRAIEHLKRLGITNAMVKAGGDLRVIGKPPGQDCWTVQLEDPNKAGARLTVELREAALSTSGDYENYFEHGGKRYSHILDPRTGLPVPGIAACTVIAPTCMESDAWATACIVYGVEKSLADFGSRYAMRFTLRSDAPGESLTVKQSPDFPVPKSD